MLQALNKNGKFITLAACSSNDIELLRKQESFYCPSCGQQVIPRAGPHTIPHFAHHSSSSCDSIRGGEGPYHEKGKLLLYQWLIHQNIHVVLEKYLPSIRRRPDLYIELYNKIIVVEFQCARVPVKEIQQRNKDFKKIGITPIWIMGAELLEQATHNQIKLNAFTLQFIHRFTPHTPYFLYYFCPRSQQFIIASQLFFLSKYKTTASLRIAKLNTVSFKHLFQAHQPDHKELIHIWKREKYRFRTSHLGVRKGKEMLWYHWLYSKNTHIHYLPKEVYLPVKGQHVMKTSLWDWQSRICLDIIDPLKLGEAFSVEQCFQLLQTHLLSSNYFPLINSNSHPIQYYLNWLERLLIIKRTSATQFKKMNDFIFYNHIEKAIKADEELFIRKNK